MDDGTQQRLEAIPDACVRPPAAGDGLDAVVAARDLTRRYGSGDAAVDALRGVSIDLRRGRFTAIMGPSGSGKSTLMHVMAGLDEPTSGTVWIDGVEITALKERQLTQLRRDKIGFIFQTFNLLPMLTARENLVLPLTIAGRKIRRRLARHPGRARSIWAIASTTARRSCRAASSSAWPSPGRSSAGRS